jgi:hypothetical protein
MPLSIFVKFRINETKNALSGSNDNRFFLKDT